MNQSLKIFDTRTRYSCLRPRKRAIVYLYSVALVLLTLEVCTRLFATDPSALLRFDPAVGSLFRPHLNTVITSVESGESLALQTNSRGFRGAEWAIPKPAGVRRIAVLGDSYTEAQQFDTPQIFCHLLEERLNLDASDGIRWEVMNFGISGCSTPGELAVYETHVRPFDPDIVLLCANIANDLPGNSLKLTHDRRPAQVFAELNEANEVVLSKPFSKRAGKIYYLSQFYVWQRDRVQSLIDSLKEFRQHGKKVPLKAAYWNQQVERAVTVLSQNPKAGYEDAWKMTRVLIERFRLRVEVNAGQFLLVNLPETWQVYPEQFETALREIHSTESIEVESLEQQFEQLALDAEVPLLDLVHHFRSETSGNDDREWLFLNGSGHFNARGHQLAAERIYEFLKRNAIPRTYDTSPLAEHLDHTTIR